MSSGTFYPVVDGDDGCWNGGFLPTGNVVYIGYYTVSRDCFIRFPSITIPQGSTITSAFVKLTPIYNDSGEANVNVYFNNIDNAVAPTSGVEVDALALTSNVINWIPGDWIDGVQEDSPSLVSVIQEVINRGGWSEGNALQIIVKDNGSSTKRRFSSIEWASGAEKAELHVTWALSVNANVTNPSIQANGYTGIYAVSLIPAQQAQGYTGIYSAPSIPMIQPEGFTGITAEPSISMPIAIVTCHDDIVHAQASMTIPSMSAKLTQAKQIWGNVSIPSMIAEATERETTLANVSIPMITAELASGIHADLEATAPMATAEGLFSGQAEITIPMMTAELEGKVGRVISSAVKVPMMTVEATGKTEHLVNGAVSIPMIRAKADLMTGKIIAGAAEIPMITAALTSYEDITGDIDVSIPAMIAYLEGTTERAVCTVLRYNDKPDILGSMAAEIPMIEASLTEL